MLKLTAYNKRALYGGLIATLITGMGVFLIGNVSGYEAKLLIKATIPGIDMLCNTIVLASATILALLLTLLSISYGAKSRLKEEHYFQVLLIARVDTIVFVAAIVVFQLFNIPITEADEVPTWWYSIIYWSTLFISSLLSGGLVSVILMLYNTVVNIIKIVGLNQTDHPLIYTEEKEKEEEEKDE